MKKITINLSYYNQSEMLKTHIREWASWNEEIRNKFHFCIVDDCSKAKATDALSDMELHDLDIAIYRVSEDKPWNQPGAANLGMKHCPTEYAIILDMDTIITEKFAIDLLKLTELNQKDVAYKFKRKFTNGKKHTPHPKVCLLNKDTFWEVDAYDEDFCGNYGLDDSFFWWKWKFNKKEIVLKEKMFLIIDGHDLIESLERDCSVNKKLYNEKIKSKTWSKDCIRFNSERVL
jgi:hypothetical protein